MNNSNAPVLAFRRCPPNTVEILAVIFFCLWCITAHAKTLPELIQDLSSNSLEVRLAATQEIKALGSSAAPAVDALTKLLLEKNPEGSHNRSAQWLRVRISAVQGLRAIGPEAESAYPVLNQLYLSTRSNELRRETNRAITDGIGMRAMPHLLKDLKEASVRGDNQVQLLFLLHTILSEASATNTQLPRAQLETAVQLFVEIAKSRRISVMMYAIDNLGLLGPNAIKALPMILDTFKDERFKDVVSMERADYAGGSNLAELCEAAFAIAPDDPRVIQQIRHARKVYVDDGDTVAINDIDQMLAGRPSSGGIAGLREASKQSVDSMLTEIERLQWDISKMPDAAATLNLLRERIESLPLADRRAYFNQIAATASDPFIEAWMARVRVHSPPYIRNELLQIPKCRDYLKEVRKKD